MPLIRDIGRTAYEYVDPRLRAEQRAAEGGLNEKKVQERAGQLLDEWMAAENLRQVAASRHPSTARRSARSARSCSGGSLASVTSSPCWRTRISRTCT